ncbi:TPA: hypothetical protein OB786_000284 [Escherichia fergusonii]|uniref:hypothetical protein n=1 Tax=Escherichia fergusonii TaxID=564 RepID=UPI000F682937|nr:hypothetical protein [Escherichia fergusonii]EHG5999427.1 hypothetical protein [Escherichia fergusonii]MBA8502669.1 hypothetical protein [Escherichia fergusonii]QCZ33109.1 hypothetical protein D8Z79_015410 [Escherichia fergusonii]HAI1303476.1 hypothetical protein [Escherichia fergusonii]HCO8232338.1 hypothetical protein [Escherichia fergusonii]
MNMTAASDYYIDLDYLSSVEQLVTKALPSYFMQYINSPDSVPTDIRQEFDEQLISIIFLFPELLKKNPTYFSLYNKSKHARVMIFDSSESMASFLQGDTIFFWLDDEQQGRYDNVLQNENEEEICTLREKIWLALTKAVHAKIKLFLGEYDDEYIWTSVYSEQNLDELLEYINKLIIYQNKFIEHSHRGTEIYPDDLLCLLENPYCEYDPLDYTQGNIELEQSDTVQERQRTKHDWLFENK